MSPPPAAHSQLHSLPPPKPAWTLHLLLFALLFAGLMLLHAPLLRLPYFWDEAGYYIPAARDLLLIGLPIPHSTLSNAHPPLVMAWLALAWRVFGYSPLVTHTAMLTVAAFSLLGLFRLAKAVTNFEIACAATLLTAIYPVFFTQSSLAHIDLAAAGFTYWALLAYFEDCPWKLALWFSLAALAKETAIVIPLALFAWHLIAWHLIARFVPTQREKVSPPPGRRIVALHLLIPLFPLACWFAYHHAKTGFFLGNPDYLRYNLGATINPLRVPLAFGMRLWQVFGYFGLYLLTASALLSWLFLPQDDAAVVRPGFAKWQRAAFAAVSLAYLLFVSVAGGAVLARYLLPVLPVTILFSVTALWQRLRQWKLIIAAVAVAFVAGWFTNPPYGFSLEDNFAYRDFVVMHAEASRFLAMRYPNALVLTAWPASDELTRPWLGYVARPSHVVRIEDFTSAQIELASSTARSNFDVAFVFSTKYQPSHEWFAGWSAWQGLKERFFGYHRDLPPEEIARRLGGTIVFHKEGNGLWAAVIEIEKAQEADARPAENYSNR